MGPVIPQHVHSTTYSLRKHTPMAQEVGASLRTATGRRIFADFCRCCSVCACARGQNCGVVIHHLVKTSGVANVEVNYSILLLYKREVAGALLIIPHRYLDLSKIHAKSDLCALRVKTNVGSDNSQGRKIQRKGVTPLLYSRKCLPRAPIESEVVVQHLMKNM